MREGTYKHARRSESFSSAMAKYWSATTGILPLVTFRVLFGLVAAFGALRFMWEGWVERLIGTPSFFFSFYGFEWLPRVGVTGGYIVYSLIAISAICVSLGYRYRLSLGVFWLTFTYAELFDATNYLNHYYLVILLAGLLFFIPANGAFSLDIRQGRRAPLEYVPRWMRDALLLQLGMVYFFAGLAKVNADWLLEAMPMAIWLPERGHYPILGWLFEEPTTAYVFSWAGCLYDLTIVGWLLWKPTRKWAYLAVLVFHAMTLWLFNIGLFPLIMVTSTILFFDASQQRSFFLQMGAFLNRMRLKAETFLTEVVVWNSYPELQGQGFGLVYGVRNMRDFLKNSTTKRHAVPNTRRVLKKSTTSKPHAVPNTRHVHEHTTTTKRHAVPNTRHVLKKSTTTKRHAVPNTRHVTNRAVNDFVPNPNIVRCSEHVTVNHQNHLTCSEHVTVAEPKKRTTPSFRHSRVTPVLLGFYFLIQLILPLRALAYPGPSTWSEEGYRYGWRVMLVEKAGVATFTVKDQATGAQTVVNNLDYLTPYQEKQMAIQPDFILQFAHLLGRDFSQRQGYVKPAVFVESYVALNGRRSKTLVDPYVDLIQLKDGLSPKPWILPCE